MQKLMINYRQIYVDIIDKKYPHKKEECNTLLTKKNLSFIDILELNQKVFGRAGENKEINNQIFRSYSKSDILYVLDYQKKYDLNNSQLASYFKMSRNTITKWKRLFIIK